MWRQTRVNAGRRAVGECLEPRLLLSGLADLAPSGLVPSTQTMPGLTTVSITFTVKNTGAVSAGAFNVEFFWSADADFGNGDEVTAPLSPGDPFFQPANTNAVAFMSLTGGYQTTRVVTLTVPASPLVGTSGICYLGMRVDEGNAVAESDEANNYGQGTGVSEVEMFWAVETYLADMAADPSWSIQGAWAYGTPSGNASDPVSGATGAEVIGYNLDGEYANDIPGTHWAMTPPISTAGYSNITLSFMRWLNIEDGLYDKAYVAASTNGTTWTILWSNPLDAPLFDDHWVPVTYALPASFSNQAAIYIRWGLGPTDFMVNYGGWNIDDVVVRGQAGTSATPARPDLLAAYDTGVSSSDDLTRFDNSSSAKRMTFRVGGTVAGATVTIYCDGVAIGSGVASGSTTDVLTDGASAVADGSHQIVARQTQPGMSQSAGSTALAVTIDVTAPVQTAFIVADGEPQRSMVKSLGVTFGEEVNLNSAVVLQSSGGASLPQIILTLTNPSLDKRTYIGTFSGVGVMGGSLPDGIYSLYVNAAGVVDMAGNVMVGSVSNRFHRLFGDADGDRDVDNADLLDFRKAMNKPAGHSAYWYFDFDDNGAINGTDYAQFKQRLTRRVVS